MIWFFLAGLVAGAVGWNMFVCWIGKRIMRQEQMEAFAGNKGLSGSIPTQAPLAPVPLNPSDDCPTEPSERGDSESNGL